MVSQRQSGNTKMQKWKGIGSYHDTRLITAIYNHDDILYFESQVNKFTNQAKAEALMSAVHPSIHTSGIFYWKKY